MKKSTCTICGRKFQFQLGALPICCGRATRPKGEWLSIDGEPDRPSDGMKAISLWQPWASLVALEFKRWETRPQKWNHRGVLAIQAAKTDMGFDQLTGGQNPVAERHIQEALEMTIDEMRARLPRGSLVATVNVKDCISTNTLQPTKPNSRRVSRQERVFGNYRPNRFAIELGDVVLVREPIEWPGSRGFFRVGTCRTCDGSRRSPEDPEFPCAACAGTGLHDPNAVGF